jgi:hypothetical protein
MEKIFAQSTPQSIIGGTIKSPTKYGGVDVAQGGGLIQFFSNILQLVFVVAGIYAFINFILAGFQYMSAGGDTKALTAAWGRIWQSLIGLVIIAGSFALISLFSYILFGDATFILKPKIYGPN